MIHSFDRTQHLQCYFNVLDLSHIIMLCTNTRIEARKGGVDEPSLEAPILANPR
jgi:hypothetical protein